jgi:hypothetical protein
MRSKLIISYLMSARSLKSFIIILSYQQPCLLYHIHSIYQNTLQYLLRNMDICKSMCYLSFC